MKFLKSGQEISKEIIRCISDCEGMYWAVAWASYGNTEFKLLTSNKDKIRKLYVGIHFYQTHPNFIEEFIGYKNVLVAKDTSGVFHPKLYLFDYGDGIWECVIGSANFTNGAFSRNEESAVLITNYDDQKGSEYKNIMSSLSKYEKFSEEITEQFANNYRKIWGKQQKRISKLGGQFTSKNKSKKTKSPIDSEIFTLEWQEFLERVKDDQHHSLAGRTHIVNEAHRYFEDNEHFSDMTLEQRKNIAGINRAGDMDWGWFGSMVGSGVFKNRIIENDANISAALDSIPLNGPVSKNSYLNYVRLYKQAFPDDRNYLGTGTRLLALKRPDYFICLDSTNKNRFCSDFGITMSSLSLDNYWDEVVERIQECVWWREEQPIDAIERNAWNARAALLDAIYYIPINE